MKLMPRFINSFYIGITIMLAAVIAIYCFCPTILSDFAYINWLALLVLVIFCVCPRGNIKLSSKNNSTKSLPVFKWLAAIILLQLSLLFIFIGLAELTGVILPIHTETHSNTAWPALQETMLHFGLYPWALMALFAIAFALSSYTKSQNSFIANICSHISNKKYEILTISANLTGRATATTLISLSFVTTTFLIASLLMPTQELLDITGFSVAAIGTSIVMLLICLRKKISPILTTVENHRPILGILIQTLIFSVFLSILTLLVHYMGTGQKETPLFFASILAKGWQLHWQLLYTLYWLTTIPISAILIAKFSYGYSIRSVILGSLLMPLLLALLLIGFKYAAPGFIITIPKILAAILGIIGFVLLILFLFNSNNLPSTIQCYLPKPDSIKSRSKELFSQRWKRMTGLLFYLFIPAGIFVVAILMSLLIIPMLLITLGVVIVLSRVILK